MSQIAARASEAHLQDCRVAARTCVSSAGAAGDWLDRLTRLEGPSPMPDDAGGLSRPNPISHRSRAVHPGLRPA